MDNVLHHFGSKIVATNVSRLVAKIPGNGGQKCFRVDECPISSRPGRRIYRIQFLPENFKHAFPGHVVPSVDVMAGWVRGYCYAMNLR